MYVDEPENKPEYNCKVFSVSSHLTFTAHLIQLNKVPTFRRTTICYLIDICSYWMTSDQVTIVLYCPGPWPLTIGDNDRKVPPHFLVKYIIICTALIFRVDMTWM